MTLYNIIFRIKSSPGCLLFEADIYAIYVDADAVVQTVKALTFCAAALISSALAGVIKAIANEKHSFAISGLTFLI